MTQHVFTLTENYRVMEDPVFGNILKNLRTGNLSDRGAERLMRQCLHLQNNEAKEEKNRKRPWNGVAVHL